MGYWRLLYRPFALAGPQRSRRASEAAPPHGAWAGGARRHGAHGAQGAEGEEASLPEEKPKVVGVGLRRWDVFSPKQEENTQIP